VCVCARAQQQCKATRWLLDRSTMVVVVWLACQSPTKFIALHSRGPLLESSEAKAHHVAHDWLGLCCRVDKQNCRRTVVQIANPHVRQRCGWGRWRGRWWRWQIAGFARSRPRGLTRHDAFRLADPAWTVIAFRRAVVDGPAVGAVVWVPRPRRTLLRVATRCHAR